jgi:hypothetical protein
MADELFDQEALQPAGWLEPPLPLDLGPHPEPQPVRPRPAQNKATDNSRTDDHAHDHAHASDSHTAEESSRPRLLTDASAAATSGAATGIHRRSAEAGGDSAQDHSDTEHAHRRSGKGNDKPRMPSWDDILLGVRRKSE